MKLEAAEGIGTGHSHIIRRPRLTRLLDETSARIILLVAPAGYEKTTLAREWLSERPHVWYRGTLATADIAALALGIAKAATVIPGAGDRLKSPVPHLASTHEGGGTLANLLADDLVSGPPGAWMASMTISSHVIRSSQSVSLSTPPDREPAAGDKSFSAAMGVQLAE